MNNAQIQSHFDLIANDYDFYKQKNSYYYAAIKDALKQIVEPNKRILDFGCGTGDILNFLKPKYGIGIDLSPKLIETAKKKFKSKNLNFKVENKPPKGDFDYIIMIDVIEHLANPEQTFKDLAKTANKKTILIISFVSSKWEPILDFLEKIKFKMPEGPHQRITTNNLLITANKNKLTLIEAKTIAPLPGSLSIIKQILEKLNLGPISFLVFEKK